MGAWLIVAELYGRLAAFDCDDQFVSYLAEAPDCHAEAGWPRRPGWPSCLAEDGRAKQPELSNLGHVNSPHSLAVDSVGNLFVSEWLLGGRYCKSTPTHE